MGGTGSGTWYRWNKKTTAEEIKRIDIRYMRKQGMLKPRGWCRMTWERGGEPSGDIKYQADETGLDLSYRSRSPGEEWEPVTERVWFDRTPCHYGGERLWFKCPHCSKRVAVLYGLDVRFLCRHCYQLPYATQQEGYCDRMMRKARKIRARLGASNDLTEPVWSKPKGMHQNTYYRLLIVERKANRAASDYIDEQMRAMGHYQGL